MWNGACRPRCDVQRGAARGGMSSQTPISASITASWLQTLPSLSEAWWTRRSVLRDHLVDYIGTHTFEGLCREWVAVQADSGHLAFLPERIGSFWSQQAQVDVVAINWRTKDILLGECKWGTVDVSRRVIRTLVTQAEKVLPGKEWTVHLAFFARSAFTAAAQAEAKSVNASLVTLEQIEEDIIRWMQGRR